MAGLAAFGPFGLSRAQDAPRGHVRNDVANLGRLGEVRRDSLPIGAVSVALNLSFSENRTQDARTGSELASKLAKHEVTPLRSPQIPTS